MIILEYTFFFLIIGARVRKCGTEKKLLTPDWTILDPVFGPRELNVNKDFEPRE